MKKKQKTDSDTTDPPKFKESSEEKPIATDDTFQLSDDMVFHEEQDDHFIIENEVDETFNLLNATTVRDEPTQDSPVIPPFEKHVTMVPGGDLDAVRAFEPASPKPSTDNTVDSRLESAGNTAAQDAHAASIRKDSSPMSNEADPPPESKKTPPSPDEKKEAQEPHKSASSKDVFEEKEEDILELSSQMLIPSDEDPAESPENGDGMDLSAPTILMEEPIEPFKSVLEASSPESSEHNEDDVLDLSAASMMMVESDSPDIKDEAEEKDEVVDLDAPTIMMSASDIKTALSDQADSSKKEDDILDLGADNALETESDSETGPANGTEEEEDVLDLSAANEVMAELDAPDVNEETGETHGGVDLNAPTIMMAASEIETALSDQADSLEKEDDILDLSADSVSKEESDLNTASSEEAASSEKDNPPLDLSPESIFKEEPALETDDDGILDLSKAAMAVDESDSEEEPDITHETEDIEEAVDLNASTIILSPPGHETDAPDIQDSEFDEDSILDLGAVDAKIVTDEMPSSSEPAPSIQAETSPSNEEAHLLPSDSGTAPQKEADDGSPSDEPASDSTDDMEFKLPDDFPMPIFDEFPEPDDEGKDQQAENELSMTGILDTLAMPDRGDVGEDGETDALIDMSILDADMEMFSGNKTLSPENLPEHSPLPDKLDEKQNDDDIAESEEKTPHETEEVGASGSAVDAAPAEDAEESVSGLAQAKPSSPITKSDAPVKNGGIPIIEILPEGGEVDLPHAKTCHSSFTRDQIEKALERVIEKIFAEKIEGILQNAVEKAVAEEVKRLTNLMMIDDMEDF